MSATARLALAALAVAALALSASASASARTGLVSTPGFKGKDPHVVFDADWQTSVTWLLPEGLVMTRVGADGQQTDRDIE